MVYFHQTQSITDLCRFSRCISSSHYKQQTQENFLLNRLDEFYSHLLTYY